MNKRKIVIDYMKSNDKDRDIIKIILKDLDTNIKIDNINLEEFSYNISTFFNIITLRFMYKNNILGNPFTFFSKSTLDKVYTIIIYKKRNKIISEL